jgi:hypothetical protein
MFFRKGVSPHRDVYPCKRNWVRDSRRLSWTVRVCLPSLATFHLDTSTPSWFGAASGFFVSTEHGTAYIHLKENVHPPCLSSHLSTDPRAESESESELLYDWRSVSQFILVSGTLWGPWPDFTFSFCYAGKLLYSLSCCALSDERTDL